MQLTKSFGGRDNETAVVALNTVDFNVASGEFVAVLGPSGCGKTTLLRSIAGFETPDSGFISVDGETVFAPGRRSVPAHERGIGFVPQDGALFPHLSVAQNVGFGLRHMNSSKRRQRVQETLDLVGLGNLGKRRPHELSGGQQQRIALARAIAPGPRVVLLDEPFSALDEYLRETLRNEVRQLLRTLGSTVVLVTHDQEEALALGDRVAVMRAGEMVQVGPPDETYYQPNDLELARFMGETIIVDGHVKATEPKGGPNVSCAFGNLPVSVWHGRTGRCDVLIRPENIRVSLLSSIENNYAAENQSGVIGTIRDRTFYGHDSLLCVDVPELSRTVPVRIIGDRNYAIGDQVLLEVENPVCTYAT